MSESLSGTRLSRRLFLMTPVALAPAVLPSTSRAFAPVESAEKGEMPTTGGFRPGPFGFVPKPWEITGVQPIAIKIEKAKVDSQVEVQEIVDGVMLNPSGPFIVSWYRETGKLGANDNAVFAGHLDYWDVGQAVFWELGSLKKKDTIEVTGADEVVYQYRVDWVRNYQVADLDAKAVQKIVGRTEDEKLTLITCGGPFDYNAGVYLERMVVRGSRIVEEVKK